MFSFGNIACGLDMLGSPEYARQEGSSDTTDQTKLPTSQGAPFLSFPVWQGVAGEDAKPPKQLGVTAQSMAWNAARLI